MCELTENLGAVLVRGIGNAAQVRNACRIPGTDKAARHLARWMYGLALDDDQSDATARPFLVIGPQVVRGETVARTKRCEMRLEHHAVAQFYAADHKRRQKVCEGR